MANKLFDDELDFEVDDLDSRAPEAVIKKCHCGYKGELLPDPFGYACANCGFVLIETR